jgi:hypothetical protein
MTLKEFAMKYRLQIRRVTGDAEGIIPGREGRSHIFYYGSGLLGVAVMPDTITARRWRSALSAFTAAGLVIRQSGDTEGVATFIPESREQSRVALKYAKVRSKRRISDSQKARLRELGFKKISGADVGRCVTRCRTRVVNVEAPSQVVADDITTRIVFRVPKPFLRGSTTGGIS